MSTTSMTLNTSKISLQMLKEYTVAEGVLAFYHAKRRSELGQL